MIAKSCNFLHSAQHCPVIELPGSEANTDDNKTKEGCDEGPAAGPEVAEEPLSNILI